MKKVLQAWLADNTVTVDNKTDKILILKSRGTLTLDDVIDEMLKQDTGLRIETLRHSIDLFLRILTDLILNGYSVNTGLFRAVAQLTGVVEGGVWNKEKNSIYVSLTQDKALREAILETAVEILGEKPDILYILETQDIKTGRRDGTATAGRILKVLGNMLKKAGDDPAVGITLTNDKGVVTTLEDEMLDTNTSKLLSILIPADLPTGEYTLTVTTQFSTGRYLLKEPRSVSTTIWIGGKPSGGGGEEERPGEL